MTFKDEKGVPLAEVTLFERGGTSKFYLTARNLQPEQTYYLKLHGGSCDSISASFTYLTEFVADSKGNASTAGSLLYRNLEIITLPDITAGDHLLILESNNFSLCNAIPKHD